MRRCWLVVVCAIVLASHIAYAADAEFANLDVRVNGVRNNKGEVGVALFNSPLGYPIHIEHAYQNEWVPLHEGQQGVEVTFEGLPAGDYAVSVVHDENGTRQLERTGLGFPKEGVGFSNGQKVKLSATKFSKSKFVLAKGENKAIIIQLDYRE